jgi:hypothetical protein
MVKAVQVSDRFRTVAGGSRRWRRGSGSGKLRARFDLAGPDRRGRQQPPFAFPDVSAEPMLNEDYAFARQKDEAFFVRSFRVAGLPLCMTAAETAKFSAPKPRLECRATRAKAVAVKS